MERIDPGRLYSFSQAAQLIPSSWAARTDGVSLDTLHRWRKAGRLRAEPRQIGKRRFWFVWGAELAHLLPPLPGAREGPGRGWRSQEKRERDSARAAARVLGG